MHHIMLGDAHMVSCQCISFFFTFDPLFFVSEAQLWHFIMSLLIFHFIFSFCFLTIYLSPAMEALSKHKKNIAVCCKHFYWNITNAVSLFQIIHFGKFYRSCTYTCDCCFIRRSFSSCQYLPYSEGINSIFLCCFSAF